MSSGMLITENVFSTRRCTMGHEGPGFDLPLMQNGPEVGCAHCGKVIYPDLLVLRDHEITCDGDDSVWRSRGMNLEVHRCSPGHERHYAEVPITAIPIW